MTAVRLRPDGRLECSLHASAGEAEQQFVAFDSAYLDHLLLKFAAQGAESMRWRTLHRRRRRKESADTTRAFLSLLRLVKSRVGRGQLIEEASEGRLACAWTVEEGGTRAMTAAAVGEERSLPGPVRRVGGGAPAVTTPAGADVLRDEAVVEVRRWPETGAGPSQR